jgi:hypothetical protein
MPRSIFVIASRGFSERAADRNTRVPMGKEKRQRIRVRVRARERARVSE